MLSQLHICCGKFHTKVYHDFFETPKEILKGLLTDPKQGRNYVVKGIVSLWHPFASYTLPYGEDYF